MSMAWHADSFVVINGPEDGTEFPIVRAPLTLGSDPACAIHLRLDAQVRKQHARLTAVSDGYRIRCHGPAPTWVGNKRVGALRSRVVRAGAALRVGNTLLCLECAPEGLASRSRGIVAESDLGWAVRQGLKSSVQASGQVASFISRTLRRLFGSWFAIGAMVFAAMVFWPQFRYTVRNILYHLYYRLLDFLQTR